MSANAGTLTLLVDSTSVSAGERALTSFEKTGARTEKNVKSSMSQVETAMKRMGQQSGKLDKSVLSAAKSADGLSGSVSGLGKSLTANSYGIRMVAMQLGQVTQQMASGTSAARALSIQMPDLLLGFGTFGAVAGVVAGALGPMVAGMVSSGDAMKVMSDQLADAEDALDGYKSAAELAAMTTGQLEEKFGSAGRSMQTLLTVIEDLKQREGQRAIDALSESMSEMLAVAGDGEKRGAIADFFDVNIFLAFTDAGREARDVARELTGEFLNAQTALDYAATIEDGTARLDEQIAAAERLLNVSISLAEADGKRTEAEDGLISKIAESLRQMRLLRGAVEDTAKADENRAAVAQELIDKYAGQADLANAIASYGADSAEVEALKRAEALRTVDAMIEQKGLSGDVAQGVREAALAAYDAQVNSANAAIALRDAEAAANGLASAIASAAGFSANLENGVRVLEAQVTALQSGADAAIASTIETMRIKAEQTKQAQIAAGVDRFIAEAQYSLDLDAISSQEQLLAKKKALTEATKSSASAGSKHTRQLERELDAIRESLNPITAYNAKMAKLAELRGALTNDEFAQAVRNLNVELADSLPLVGELTDTLVDGLLDGFDGTLDSMGDLFKSWLKEMIATAAKNQIIMSLNLNPMGGVGGAVSAAGAVGGAGGGGMLGNLLGLGNLGSGLMGGGGFLGGIGTGLGGVLSGGGLGSSFANLGGLLTGTSGGLGAIGAALPAIGIIAGVGGLLSKGLSQKYAGTALRGTLDSEGFDGGQFDFYKGGFLRGNREEWSDAPSALSEYIDQAMTGVVGSIETYADALALSTKSALQVAGEEFTIWLSDLSEDEIIEALNSEVQAVADEMAALVLGTDQFTRSGETASEALARLGQGILAVNDATDLLGHRIWNISIASADAASELVEAFGGLEAMTSAVNTYFSTMYSEEERLAINTRRLSDTFADLGVVFPQTREEYRQLVESIDTTSEAGRNLYANLISLSGAMDAVLGPLFGFSPEIAAMIDSATALIDTQISERQELARTLEQSSKLWLRTAETLRDFLTDLRTTSLGGLNPAQMLEATAMQYADTFAAARGGDIDAAGSYISDAKAYLSAVDATAATAVDYRRAALQVERDTQLLAGISEFEGAKDQYISDLYEAQISVLEEMKTLLQSGDLTADALADLNGTLGELQSVIEAAEVLSYDYLRHNLDLVLDLIPSADIPPELQDIIEAAGGSLETLIDLIFRDEDLDPGMRFLLAGEAINGVGILDIALTEPDTALAGLLATGVMDGAATLTAEIGAGTPEGLAALLSDGVYTAEAFAKMLFADGGSKALKRAIRSGEFDLDALIDGKILGDNPAAKLLRKIGRATTSWINVGGEFEFDPSSDLTSWFDNSLANGVAAPIASLGNMIGGLVGALTSYEAAIDKKAADLAAEQERLAKIATVQAKLDKFDSNWGANSAAKVEGYKDELEALAASTGVTLNGIKINDAGKLVYDSSGVSGTVAQLNAFRSSGFWDDGGLQDKIAAANKNVANANAYEDKLTDRLTNLQSFDGGGYTGSGARSGGVDGKGGFPAILHPNETVTDHSKSGGGVMSSLLSEISALRREVASLKGAAERGANATVQVVKHTKRSADIDRKWDTIGLPATQSS